jgi:DNA-binding response OmpR family regulator
MAKILVVEDETNVAAAIVDLLTYEHHIVETADNGADALHLLQLSQFDLAILDWRLPVMDGLEVCKTYRARGGTIPILMLTGKSLSAEKELGLDSGADDYLTKPFDMRELAARTRALLRRPPSLMGNVLEINGLVLDRQNYKVSFNDKPISLLPKEFDLLEFFMRHRNRVFSLDSLLEHVWASAADVSPDAVRQCIKRLRKKLEDAGCSPLIQSVYGVGYKLESI